MNLSMPNDLKPVKVVAPRTLKELRLYYQASEMSLKAAGDQIARLYDRCEHYRLAHDHLKIALLSASRDEVEQLNYVINYIRLPLKIDPSIPNLDAVRMLAAFNTALKRLNAL